MKNVISRPPGTAGATRANADGRRAVRRRMGIAAFAAAGVLATMATGSAAAATSSAGSAAAVPTRAPCPVKTVNVLFDTHLNYSTSCLAVPAGKPTTVVMVNEDLAVSHDFNIWTRNFLKYGDNPKLFSGRSLIGGQAAIYEIPALPPGRYFFDCSYHVSSPSIGMHGTFWVVKARSR